MDNGTNNLKQHFQDNTEKCTIAACVSSADQHHLQCLKCKRKVHYQCTLLPLYQIQQYLTFGSNYRTFTCRNCVIIQEDLREIISAIPNTKACQIETLHFELETQKTLVKSYEQEISTLREKLKSEDQDNPTKKRKRNQQEEDLVLHNEALNNEIKQLRQESETLKTLLDERETTLDETLTKLNESESESVSKSLDQNQLLKEMKNIMNHRIEQMENKIEGIIDKKIEEKNNISIGNENLSFAETLKKNLTENTIEKAIEISKNNEKIQEIERTKREKNLIIHGVYENEKTDEENNNEDQNFIDSFLGVIGVNVKPISITRIGKLQEGKIRPIKLVMNSTENKYQIMSRLVNLKNAEEKFKKLSVKDDYTFEERQIIKIWHQKADEKNKNENTTMWKVRGTPKNGLRIVKVMKKQERNQLYQGRISWGTESMETTVETNWEKTIIT